MRELLISRPLAIASLALCGCTSLLIANGFKECTTDGDCANGGVCAQNFCLPLPAGCSRAEGATATSIPVAALLPITTGGDLDGGVDDSEVAGLNAYQLAQSEINDRGIADRRIALYVCNTAGDKQRVRDQAKWMADELHVPVVFTSGSSQTLSAANETITRDVLIMTATSTSPELTSLPATHNGSARLVWRTAPSDALQGKVIAAQIGVLFPTVTHVGVVYNDDPYGQGLNSVFSSGWRATAGHDLCSFQFTRDTDAATITNVVNQLSGCAPQMTVLIGFPEDTTRIIDEAQKHANLQPASHKWFFSDSSKDPAVLTATVAPVVNGAYGTAPAQGAGAAFADFRNRYQTKFNKDPNDYSFTSHSYDAMYLVALSMAWAVGADGTGAITGPKMADGLTHMSSGTSVLLQPDQFTQGKAAMQAGTSIDVEGSSGHLNFDPNTGEAPSKIELWQVNGTGFETRALLDPPN